MFSGIIAGVTWALETVILGIALAMSPLCSTEQAIFLAPFVSTFLHDACSAVCAWIYNAVKGNLGRVWRALKTKSGKWVILAALIGGPVGMTGYVLAVNYMGASIGAVAHCTCNYVPHIAEYFDMGDLMAMACPLPYVQVSGVHDPDFFFSGSEAVFAQGKRAYEAAGISEKCVFVRGEEGHRFYADQSWPWVHQLLKK